MAIRNSISWARISNPRSGHNRFHLARRLVRVLCGAAAFLMVFPHLSTLATARIPASQNVKHPPLRLLTKVEEIRNLSREESARGYSVHVQAVVTFADLDRQILFVQDRTGGIFVDVPLESGLSLKAGELVDIKGSTEVPDFAPDLGKARISIVGHSALPTPIRLSAESLESVTMDCMWVEVEGVVRSLEVKGVSQYARQYWEQDISTPKFRTPNPMTLVRVIVAVGHSRIPVYVLHSQALNPESYLGARVRVRGVRGSFFNQKNQVVGVNLFVPGLAQIQVVEAPPPIAAVAMSSLMQYTAHGTLNQRVKVEGVVTLQDPGRALFIASAGSSTRVETRQGEAFNPGDYVEVVGFPTMGDFSPLLEDATVHRLRPGPEVSPAPITAEKALTAEGDGDLVRIDGRLVGAGVAPEGATWALEAGSVPFLARLPATSLANRKLPPIGEGSLLRLTGVCVVNADQNGRPISFEILLRSPRDVMVLESPDWWTARRALTVLGLLLVVVLFVLGWVYLLRRQVNQQAELIRQKTAAEVAIAKRFEYVARATDDALWEVDLVTGTFWASPTFTATYGSLPERIPVDPAAMAEGVHPDDRAKVVGGISAAVQNRQTKWEAECRLRCLDGSYANVYARAYIERDDGGRPKRLIGALTDITARKRAEEELRVSRQLLQTTLYSLRDAVFILSFDKAEILDCNPAATEIFGYSRGEMVGRDTHFLHVDEAALLEFRKRLTAAVAEKGYLQQFEFRMRRKGGTIFPSSHSVTPLRDNQGNDTGWVSLVQDIAERKRTEEALLLSERRYRDFVSHSHEAVWRLEFDEPIPAGLPEDEQVDRFIRHAYVAECNDAFACLWGTTQAKDVIGKHMKDNPAFLEQRVASIRMSAQAGWRSLTIEYQGVDQTGNPLTLLRTTVPIVENGRLVRVWGISHDLTELKRTEEALRQSEERYRTLFENATVGIYRTTPGGRILMANPALMRMLGYERFEELSARNLEEEGFEPSYPRRSFREEIEREGVVRGLEVAWVKHDGSVIHVRESSRAICGEDGRVLYYDGVAEDITERKEAERRQNLAAEILGILNRAGTLLGTINEILRVVRQETGFDAVGVRLREGQDYPFFVQEGFSEEFVRRENPLCSRGRDGRLLCDADGHPLLECTCGLVLSGRTDPAHPLFTPGGSCWCNDTTPLLELPVEQDPRRQPRNRCIKEGYKSVALIPIRMGDEIVGLLQLNDHHPDRFNADSIRFFEGIGTSIGVALARRQDAEALRASEAEFRQSFDLSPVGTVMVGVDRRLIRCNPAFCRMLGYAEEELRGKDFLEITHPDDIEIARQKMRALLAGEVDRAQFQKRYVNKDGRVVWAEVTTGLVLDKGAPWHLLTIIQDITQRKLAEEALTNAEEKFRKAFNASPEPMSIRTIPDGRYVEVNEAFLRATGCRREEVHGKTVTEVGFRMMPEDLSRMTAILDRDGKVRDFEAHLEWTSGQVNHALISAERIELSDEPHLLLVARDITERRRMEQALEDRQRRYQDFISRSLDAVWRIEFEPPIAVDLPEEEFLASVLRRGRLAETNDALARLLGFSSAADVIGKSLNESVRESDEGRLASYRSMLQGGFRPRTIALQGTGPDGKPQYLLRTEVPIVEAGRLVRVWGMTRDITELRLAEEALKESEQRYRTLFENSAVGIYRTTPDGRVLAGNPAFARMMGYSSFEELASRDLNAEGFEPQYSRGQFKEALEKAGGITGLESQWRRRDGSVIFVREHARAIRDEAGQILYYEGVAEDITECKRAEQKAAQLAAIVESSNDAIFSANMEGIITSWNKGATMLYGYEESEVIGRNVSMLVPPGVEDDTPQLLQGIQSGEYTEHHEVVRQRSDGQRIYLSRTISPIRDSEGRIVAVSKIARDITARRQAQEELRAAYDRLAKEVTERTRAEAEIVALSQRLITAQEEERTRLARELHDDLSQQIAAVGIGLSNIRRLIPERQREGREEAERTCQRLKQLGEGIRRLSHQLHPAILEHSGLVVALESYCAEFKSLTGVRAVVQADARLDNVPANPALGIFRIAQEALQNVWKHSGTKKVVIHLARSGGQLRLCISDQGSGFDPAHRHKSKGLGLVSMRERAKLLGGTLTIESAKGRGTTVTAAIPLHAPRSARVSQAKPFLTAAAESGA
jgi:PAS domain S-box-containing protein